mgnify:CR=1 FL=1
MKQELFRTFNLTLTNGQNSELTNLYFQIFKGEHTGVLFNSFKERDTFAKFLSGDLCPTNGLIYYNERLVSLHDYKKISSQNFALVMETSRLMDNLSVYENLYFDKFPVLWFFNHKQKEYAKKLLSYFNLNIKVTCKVNSLSHYERITLEIIKAFSQKKTVIFLSNISSLLNPQEYKQLLQLLHNLESFGITFIVGETFDTMLFHITKTLHIIKNGQIIRILSEPKICQDEIQKSLGSYTILNAQKVFSPKHNSSDTILQLKSVSSSFFKELSFSIRKGEILKLFCTNSKQADLLYAYLCREKKPTHGEILFQNIPLSKVDSKLYNKQCGIILSNPRNTMVLHNMSVLDNLCLSIDRKSSGILTNSRYRKAIEVMISDEIPAQYFSEKITDVPTDIIQKIIYYRWFLAMPDLLICFNPFSIIDSNINYITKDILQKMTTKGIAVLIISNSWSMDIEVEGDSIFL